jgi:hypothetical protein
MWKSRNHITYSQPNILFTQGLEGTFKKLGRFKHYSMQKPKIALVVMGLFYKQNIVIMKGKWLALVPKLKSTRIEHGFEQASMNA